jgi:ferrochelatase
MVLSPGQGVLMVGHGTVGDIEELPEFLTKIRRGRPYPEQLLSELVHRYRTIGGSPLLAVTQRQAELLSDRLGVPVLVGMRFAGPDIGRALEQASSLGISELCILPVAPFSVHIYARVVVEACEERRLSLKLRPVDAWGTEPQLIAAHVQSIRSALDGLGSATHLILTAHSLPLSVVRAGDPYPAEVQACAQAIGAQLGEAYELCYQSQGADGGQWLGPDVLESIRNKAGEGNPSVTVAPIGFLADHVETLYDLDVEAAGLAQDLGLAFHRVPALNTHPKLVAAMAEVVGRTMRPAYDP